MHGNLVLDITVVGIQSLILKIIMEFQSCARQSFKHYALCKDESYEVSSLKFEKGNIQLVKLL